MLSVPLKRLLLDADNPRLASGFKPTEKPTQHQLLEVLWKEMAVDEVAFSIAENGYYPEERLLVIRDAHGSSFIVIEGNRRVAAVVGPPNAVGRRGSKGR